MNQLADVTHANVILHLDIDYFYAQVEEVMNPDLKEKPFGVQQGTNIVTCNYIARSFGVKKWRPLKESLEKCPDLVLVNGEDLSNYKVYSKKMAELLHTTIGPTERMGLDEHYMDITKMVEDQLSDMSEDQLSSTTMAGPFYPSEEAFTECQCGCTRRLMVGSKIAHEIRQQILEELKLTCSVGIAHNKILAKLVGQLNKPNNQTVLAPMAASMFMAELKDLRSITGIGGKTASKLEELGISSIEELQNCELSKLQANFGAETAKRLKEISVGVDTHAVKPSGKPKTVGLEDSCQPISLRSDALEMFEGLLPQLVRQIEGDGRIPQGIRVTVRKYDKVKKLSTRETKQNQLMPSFFRFVDGKIQLTDGAHDKIIKDVMDSFDHLVGLKKAFYINLIGLCFNKFQEHKKGLSSIENFLVKKSKREENDSTPQFVEQPSAETEKEDEPPAKRQKIDERKTADPVVPDIPSNVDPSVWKELPLEVQQELLRSWLPPPSSTFNLNETRCKGNSLMSHLVKK